MTTPDSPRARGYLARLMFSDGHSEEIPFRGGQRIIRPFRNPMRLGSWREMSDIYIKWEGDYPRVIDRADREHPHYDPTINLEQRFELIDRDGGVFIYQYAGTFDADGKPFVQEKP